MRAIINSMTVTKKCSRCQETMPVSEFNKKSKGGTQPYCRDCDRARSREYYKLNKDRMKTQIYAARKRRGADLAHVRHGLSDTEFESMKSRYDGRCWACKERDASHIDHDHTCCPGKTSCGKCVRGLLCIGCNVGIGMLGDSVDRLQRAMLYLEMNQSGVAQLGRAGPC